MGDRFAGQVRTGRRRRWAAPGTGALRLTRRRRQRHRAGFAREVSRRCGAESLSVVRRAALTCRAPVPRHVAVAFTARDVRPAHRHGVAMAVDVVRAYNRLAVGVSPISGVTRRAIGANEARSARAAAARNQRARDRPGVPAAVCVHGARNRRARRVPGIMQGAAVAFAPGISPGAAAHTPRHVGAGHGSGMTAAVSWVGAWNRVAVGP